MLGHHYIASMLGKNSLLDVFQNLWSLLMNSESVRDFRNKEDKAQFYSYWLAYAKFFVRIGRMHTPHIQC